MVETARQQTSPGGPSTPTTDRDAELRGNAPSSTEFDKAVSTTQPSTAPSFAEHTIRSGENLTTIAKMYREFEANQTQAVLDEILAANPSITNANQIQAGQVIRIPLASSSVPPESAAPKDDRPTYTVVKGDSLSAIAQRELGSGKWISKIIELNPELKHNPGAIKVGQVLTLPRPDELSQTAKPERTVQPIASQDAFEKALVLLDKLEGGINADRDDRGNRNGSVTNRGITQGVYDAWRSKHDEANRSVLEMSNEEWTALLKEEYWDKSDAAYLPDTLAVIHFVNAVVMHDYNANRMLQRAMGRRETGKLSDEDILAVRDSDRRSLAHLYLDKCEKRFNWVASNFEGQEKYRKGWMNRVKAQREFVDSQPSQNDP